MDQDLEILYLVDGSSYVYRAYHAIRNLSNSEGFPTNAIFGFTRMLLKLISEKSPKYLAVAFDSKGPTFRHEKYPDYKANRPPMPDDMANQLPAIKEIIDRLGIAVLEIPGYEADDIIGTLARIGEEKGFRVLMVTGDKDFRQLVSPSTSMWDGMKDRVTDYKSVKERFLFEPERFVDVMALAGDSSDNIPGVPGVGEKTAVKLIQEFGSLEKVYKCVGDIKGKAGESLKESYDKAMLSKELVEIDRFVPVDVDVHDLELMEPQRERLAELFRKFEFKDLWGQFVLRREMRGNYNLCLSKDKFEFLIAQIKDAGVVSIDTETTSKNPLKAELVGLSFSFAEGSAWYLPIGHDYPGAPVQLSWQDMQEQLRDVLQNRAIAKIGQNIKYDAKVLKRYGVELKGLHFDTMVASYLLNPSLRQHNLDYLAQYYLNHKMLGYHEVVGKGKEARSFSEVDVEQAMLYACEDADVTFRLRNILSKKLRDAEIEALFRDLEMRLIPVLIDMEMSGIAVNIDFFKEMSRRFDGLLRGIKKEIFEEAGFEFNINSPRQLGYVLFEKLQLPIQGRTAKTGNYVTDMKALKRLASAFPHKVPKLVLRYRTISKLKSTYLDALVKLVEPSTGRIHTSYNQTVTATGRLSSSEPNLQNIPVRGEEGRDIRKGFIAERGQLLISADYSQVELRVLAHYSKDRVFLEAFEGDEDIHTRTASELLGVKAQEVNTEMRRIAKAINFGIIYGMGAQKLSEEAGIDRKEARSYIEAYNDRYPGVVKYRQDMIKAAQKKGYITTLFGRRRYLPDINHSSPRVKSEAERIAVNTPIQGTAADLIKKAMINIHSRLEKEGLRAKMLLQVHDELLFEVPKEEVDSVIAMIREEMEGVYTLDVPLKVEIGMGLNWGEAH